MDPVAARDFRTMVRELATEDRTVFLTTHDMAEAEAVCDRVTLIDRGRVLATESPEALSRLLSRHERIECVGAAASVLDELGSLGGVQKVTVTGEAARIEVGAEAAVGEVMRWLVTAGGRRCGSAGRAWRRSTWG